MSAVDSISEYLNPHFASTESWFAEGNHSGPGAEARMDLSFNFSHDQALSAITPEWPSQAADLSPYMRSNDFEPQLALNSGSSIDTEWLNVPGESNPSSANPWRAQSSGWVGRVSQDTSTRLGFLHKDVPLPRGHVSVVASGFITSQNGGSTRTSSGSVSGYGVLNGFDDYASAFYVGGFRTTTPQVDDGQASMFHSAGHHINWRSTSVILGPAVTMRMGTEGLPTPGFGASAFVSSHDGAWNAGAVFTPGNQSSSAFVNLRY